MRVRDLLVCQDCVDRSGVGEFEETTLGFLTPTRCTICGREAEPPGRMRQPLHETWERIRAASRSIRLSPEEQARIDLVYDGAIPPE